MFTLDSVVPWGQSFDEYQRMFALSAGRSAPVHPRVRGWPGQLQRGGDAPAACASRRATRFTSSTRASCASASTRRRTGSSSRCGARRRVRLDRHRLGRGAARHAHGRHAHLPGRLPGWQDRGALRRRRAADPAVRRRRVRPGAVVALPLPLHLAARRRFPSPGDSRDVPRGARGAHLSACWRSAAHHRRWSTWLHTSWPPTAFSCQWTPSPYEFQRPGAEPMPCASAAWTARRPHA